MLNPQEAAGLLNLLVSLAKEGKRIEAIKEVIYFTRLSLKEAKDIVDVLIPSREFVSPADSHDYMVVGNKNNYDFTLLSVEKSKEEAFDDAKHYVEHSGYTDVKVAKVVARSRSKEVFDATP